MERPGDRQDEPGRQLPSTNITVVHRSDSSGTTKGFTQFLANYSADWKSKYGVDKDIKWPQGETGAKGNDGVAAAIKQTAGGIGYVEQAYALQNNFTFADVKNKAGTFIAPTLDSTSAAGDGLTVPADLGISTIDSANPKAYPIVSQTFLDHLQGPVQGRRRAPATPAGLKKFISLRPHRGPGRRQAADVRHAAGRHQVQGAGRRGRHAVQRRRDLGLGHQHHGRQRSA